LRGTQRRAAERERRARLEAEVARAAAEAASRAKSEFVTALNHELRTPLQAITGFTELLRTLDLPPDRRQAALGHIDAATGHVLSMADDLLDIAKIEADALPVQIEPVELPGLLDEVLALLARLAVEHDVILRSPVLAGIRLGGTVLGGTVLGGTVLGGTVGAGPEGAGPGVVQADRRRLRQVLINLVTNAVRYNRAGGWVEVAVLDSGPAASSGRVTVTVRDSGRGIPAEMLGRLFTPFGRLGAESSAAFLITNARIESAMGSLFGCEGCHVHPERLPSRRGQRTLNAWSTRNVTRLTSGDAVRNNH
jgi:signal transduction histidine kinase